MILKRQVFDVLHFKGLRVLFGTAHFVISACSLYKLFVFREIRWYLFLFVALLKYLAQF